MATKPWVRPQLISLTRMGPQESVLLTCKHTQTQYPGPVGPATNDSPCMLSGSFVGCLECQTPLLS
jgi:hypothetical protein